jgi:cysteine synthase
MTTNTVMERILENYRPALIPLSSNLTATIFPIMKIFPAEYCVRRAMEDHQVGPQTIIAETSSGTMAYGLAIISGLRDLALTIVTDPACDKRMVSKLNGLGVRVEVVSNPSPQGGYQRARLDRLHQILDENPDSWWVNQYDNPANPAAYAPVAAQIIDQHGPVDILVGTVGSGGSMCGLAAYLRQIYPTLHVVGVDTFNSVLFGQPDGKRMLRGLGNSLIPGNLDHKTFDDVHWVSAAEAFTATRILYRTTTLFQGPTSGASWLVAQWYAKKHPDARVVCVFPDSGERYLDNVYDDAYLHEYGLHVERMPSAPVCVNRPTDGSHSWTTMAWKRRTLSEVKSLETRQIDEAILCAGRE